MDNNESGLGFESMSMLFCEKMFVGEESFVIDNREVDAWLKIRHLDEKFIELFVRGCKTVEIDETLCIHCHKLLRSLPDYLIIKEFGGMKKVEITIPEIYVLIRTYEFGERNGILSPDKTNIFYVKDIFGVLHAIGINWDDGWCLHMYDLVTMESGGENWYPGCCVFTKFTKVESCK